MLINTLDPVLFSVGPIAIRWYGVMYVCAFLLTYWYASRRVREGKSKLSQAQLESLLVWLVVALIVGARVFEVVFWQPAYYWANPLKVFAVWEGGLSFHGSLVAMALAAWWLARRFRVSLAHIADVLIVPLSLGQAFGRVGNFFNSELFGRVTSLPWGVNFNGEVDALGALVFRHPNQLYEAGYNVVIFAVLWALKDKGLRPGALFALWLLLYGVCRFFTEFLRVGEPLVAGLTIGQWFNIGMVITAGVFFWKGRARSVAS